jgi:hypothetical protein
MRGQAPSQKTIYNHQTFWFKSEVTEIFPNADRSVKHNWGTGGDVFFRTRSGYDNPSPLADFLRFSLRPWVHHQFSPYARLSVSPIGYFRSSDPESKASDMLRPTYTELRTTLQFFNHIKSSNGKWMHTWRYRQEFRWQDRNNTGDYSFTNRFRVRYRIRYLVNSSDFYKDKTLYLALNNEIAVNYGKNVVMNPFSQNRLYAGIGYRFLNAARVELRYVNQFLQKGSGFEYDSLQGPMLTLYIDQLSKLGSRDIPHVRFYD